MPAQQEPIPSQLSTPEPPQLSYAAACEQASFAGLPRGSHCTLVQLELIVLHTMDRQAQTEKMPKKGEDNAEKGKANAEKGKNNEKQAAEPQQGRDVPPSAISRMSSKRS